MTDTTPGTTRLESRSAIFSERAARRRCITALATNEVRAAARSRILRTLLAILAAVTTLSVIIAAIDYRSQVADFQAYVNSATASGVTRIAPSPLRPLSLLRSSVEYLGIIGAVIAITLGHLSVARDRSNRTLALIRSRPVGARQHAIGSLVGAVVLNTALVATTMSVGVVSAGLVGNDWIGPTDAVQVLLATIAGIVYMTVFYCVGAVATARSRTAAVGLMIAFGVWLVIVMILPQLGDTLDADNQIPGGLFSALGLNRADETTVLAHFRNYETIRIGLEEASLEKHYERFAFAMTDVLDKYKDFSLNELLRAKWHDIAWLVLYPIAAIAALHRSHSHQPTFTTGDES